MSRDGLGGDKALLEDLYRAEFASMVRLAFLLTGSTAAAPDLVQDAFVAVAPRLSTTTQPGGYLRTAVVNRCRMWWRHRSVVERNDERLAATVDPLESLPTDVLEIWDLVQSLPPRSRTAVVLRFYLDLPFAEIADVMGCRVGTAKSLVHRALASLREALDASEVHP